MGKPCTAKELAQLESLVGVPLPPSLKAFYELHDGWEDFEGFQVNKLLALNDFGSAWVKKRVAWLGSLFGQFDLADPFKTGAVPIVLGESERTFTVLDTRRVRKSGEMDVVQYDLTVEEVRHESFADFLALQIKALCELVDEERGRGSSRKRR